MMVKSEEHLWQNHLRLAAGETLTAEERTELDAWYVARDQAEMLALFSPAATNIEADLKTQVDQLLRQIATATAQIRRFTEDNETLRQEIAQLRRQLTQVATLQPA